MKTKSYKQKKKFKKDRRRSKSRGQQRTVKGLDLQQYINNAKNTVPPKPYENTWNFEDFKLDQKLLSLIEEKGYRKPSEIQDKSINIILDKVDLVGVAGTGTGKTAAFLIPIIQQLIESKNEDYALIIAPTRELAKQINDEFRSLTYGLQLYSTCLIGGASVKDSLKNLRRKNHVIIGTPGRLQDMANQNALDFSMFNVLVLDEFDRMLDMGFSKEIQRINNKMSNKEQTLLFSATLEASQQKLVDEMTFEAVQVKSTLKTQDTNAIDQQVIKSKGKDKLTIIKDILSDPGGTKTILFCETKRHAENILKKLKSDNYHADSIHGNKSQRQREVALKNFKKGKVNILVATDVVARGIDVSDVELVINYQPPRNYSDYTHRIGRTGRAGKSGRAITLID